jgi:group I intron endonuclease
MTTLLEFFNIDIETLGKVGIYSIHHKYDPEKLYVGSTSKVQTDNRKSHHGFYKRFYDHTRALNLEKHHSKYLQNVINKHGIDGIVFTILEICEGLSKQQIFEKEQYYIDKLKPVYNSFDTVHPQGRIWTDEDVNKLKQRMKGKSFPKFVYEKAQKPIYQFDLNGNLINIHVSKAIAATLLNIDPSSISNCALGSRKSAGGFIWSYDGSCNIYYKNQIGQYSLDGTLIKIHKNLESAVKELKLTSRTAIKNCFSGKQKQAYGFIWKNKLINPDDAKHLGLSESRLN